MPLPGLRRLLAAVAALAAVVLGALSGAAAAAMELSRRVEGADAGAGGWREIALPVPATTVDDIALPRVDLRPLARRMGLADALGGLGLGRGGEPLPPSGTTVAEAIAGITAARARTAAALTPDDDGAEAEARRARLHFNILMGTTAASAAAGWALLALR